MADKARGLGVAVLVLAALLGGALYALRRDGTPEEVAPEEEPRPRVSTEPEPGLAPDAGRPMAGTPAEALPGPTDLVGSPSASPPAEAGTTAAPEVRSRSLASLRGAISRGLRACASRITGGPVRVFVSMSAVVGGGRIRPEQVQVRTSSPISDEAVRCIDEAVRAVSVPAVAGEPDGAFPATVSQLSGGP